MKKIILSSVSIIALASVIFLSCKDKNDGSAIAPDYKQNEGTGTNPNTTNVTTTGTVPTPTNTYNSSSMTGIGFGSWVAPTCSGGACFQMTNPGTNTQVEICFAAAPTETTATNYSLIGYGGVLGPYKATIKVTNPIGQETGSVWYSAAGIVSVVTSTAGTSVLFNNISCLQETSSYPIVTISGQLRCQ